MDQCKTDMVPAASDRHWPDVSAFISAGQWVSGRHVINGVGTIEMQPSISSLTNLVSAIVMITCEQDATTVGDLLALKEAASRVGPHMVVLDAPRRSKHVLDILAELHRRIDGPVLYVGHGASAIQAIELSTQMENSSALGIDPLSSTSDDGSESSFNLSAACAKLARSPRVFALQFTDAVKRRSELANFLDQNCFDHRGNGLYVNEESQAFVLSGSLEASGGAYRRLAQCLLQGASDLSMSPRGLYNEIVEKRLIPRAFSTLPMDLRGIWDSGELRSQIQFFSDELGTRVEAGLVGRPRGYGAMRMESSLFREGKKLPLQESASGHFYGPGLAESIEVRFIDGFDHLLGTKWLSTSDSPNREIKVFILGSCVSRDAFDLASAPELVDYRARTSLGSAFSSPTGFVKEVNLELNTSAFQRRMVKTDLEKELASLLGESHFDFLLLDLIDERLQMIRHANSYVTFSPELQACGFTPDPADLVEVGSSEYFDAFMVGLGELLSVVPAHKIIVNEVYWAEKTLEGEPVGSPAQTAKHNNVLKALYRELRRIPEIHFITYNRTMFVSDEQHKWGPSPFHFGSELYQRTIRGIERVAAGEQ